MGNEILFFKNVDSLFIACKLFDAEGNNFQKFSLLFQNFPIFKFVEGARVWAQIMHNDGAKLDSFEFLIYDNFPLQKNFLGISCSFCGKTKRWIFLKCGLGF